MTWTLVGYFPKRRATRSRWVSPFPDHPDAGFPASAPVEEICSVSDCIARGPDGWRDHGRHNIYDVYDSPALAWSVVPAEARADFDLFAYRLCLAQFERGRQEPFDEWPGLAVEPMPPWFVRLGWDAVQGGAHQSFGCSPLTCNNQAGNAGSEAGIPEVNRYGLVASAQAGIDLARHFSISEPEPGPYCVVEVWRNASGIPKAGGA